MTSAATVDNPLSIGQGLPPFERIEPAHVVPAIRELLSELFAELESLEASATPTWGGLVVPLTGIEERLSWGWGIVGHLMGVKNSPELREAYETVQPEVVKFANRFSQSRPLYDAFVVLREAHWDELDRAQQRIVEAAIRSAELSGVGLDGAARDRFNAIQLELAELATSFSNHVLDATKSFKLRLTDRDDVAGLPASALALTAQTAREKGDEDATPEDGPWVVTLDYPSFVPFMKHSRRRNLRERLYKAFITRAASGDLDNTPIVRRTLALRQEKANLLGFDTFAELSLARKMAPSPDAVEDLLEELRQASYDAAHREFAELKAFAAEQGALEAANLQQWDTRFWAERQREVKFAFEAEALRPYFPLPQVLAGLFGLARRLFGVTIAAADGEAPVWHPDVRYFRVSDERGAAIAYFYLDPYSRPAEKRGGAWMDECINRAKLATATRLPVAYLICNQTPPVDGRPSLMTFEDVETLFHEFGHGLQHMLTRVDYPGAAGINNVEWDAVELPSQFMENWCYDWQTLFSMAQHYETGEPLPEAYYQKLLAARNYMSGSAMLRQLYFSFTDLELHYRYRPDSGETPDDVSNRIAQKATVLPPIPEDAFLNSFGHIFAGGYAAGYYSYKWAEVLSADAFAAFEEAGMDDEEAIATTGRRFRDTVLGMGGSEHPMAVFREFRGREPQTAPLLRHSGLLERAT
ncbi:Zn-dependent oligopeptidase [Rubidibacter lacunae KORDI 51-2]|uniref:oligopeptidase A n=1 Tax=Rubidibacter lacunae KORDI 51-2 TaxID=582515 RepID=U5DJE7_9CHRO|nr:M3 family metallopeptidase [Rubidibacter lacunae]ERN41816.1 Zn-dependent oligopeptidase [Rubidibacter lacunae KORDI 51-2]